jgi:hypothetical protein
VRDVMKILIERANWAPETLVTLNSCKKTFAQPDEKFMDWLEGDNIIWLAKINSLIEMRMANRIEFVERWLLSDCRTFQDVIDTVRHLGWISDEKITFGLVDGMEVTDFTTKINSQYNNDIDLWD